MLWRKEAMTDDSLRRKRGNIMVEKKQLYAGYVCITVYRHALRIRLVGDAFPSTVGKQPLRRRTILVDGIVAAC
jgi:hypothetical protein